MQICGSTCWTQFVKYKFSYWHVSYFDGIRVLGLVVHSDVPCKKLILALMWIKLSCDNLKILLIHEIRKRILPTGLDTDSPSFRTLKALVSLPQVEKNAHQVVFFMSLFLLAAWPNWNARKHPAAHTFFWQSAHNGPLHASSARLQRRSVILQTGREGSSVSPPSLCGGWRAPHCVICRH